MARFLARHNMTDLCKAFYDDLWELGKPFPAYRSYNNSPYNCANIRSIICDPDGDGEVEQFFLYVDILSGDELETNEALGHKTLARKKKGKKPVLEQESSSSESSDSSEEEAGDKGEEEAETSGSRSSSKEEDGSSEEEGEEEEWRVGGLMMWVVGGWVMGLDNLYMWFHFIVY